MNDDTTLLNLECIPLFGSYERITDFDCEVLSCDSSLYSSRLLLCNLYTSNFRSFNGGFDHRFFSMGQHRFNQVGYFKNNNYKLRIPLICSYGGQYYILERLSTLISSNHIQFLHFFSSSISIFFLVLMVRTWTDGIAGTAGALFSTADMTSCCTETLSKDQIS